MNKYLLTAAAVAGLIACADAGQARTTVSGAPSSPPGPTAALHGYLKSADFDGAKVMGPPPAPDSIRGKADRAIYLENRKLAGSARWAQAIRDDDLWRGGAVSRFSCALGVRLTPRTTPRTYRMLQRIEFDVRTVGTPPKDFYNRRRPMLDDDLPVCVPREAWMTTNASYPSGHSMTGWAWALALGEIVPAKLGEVMGAGGAIGESRVICGMHYASDVEAGRKLSAAIVARLHSEPAFRKDLAAARSELSRVHTAPPADCPTS